MKRKVCFIFIGVFLLAMPFYSIGQHEALKSQLEGKRTFKEITSTVEQYLNTLPASPTKARLEKHFSRWAYYQSLHLGPEGEFVNISKKTIEAVNAQSDAPLTTANGAWYFVGPSSSTTSNPGAYYKGLGRVDRIAFHPANANIIYVGTPAGGLWKTTDGGTTWTALSNFIPSLGISGIVVDWSDPNTLYVLTGDGDTYWEDALVYNAGYVRLSVGVMVSHDGGITWQQTGALAANEYVGYNLVQHPSNSNILIAATSAGLYRTTNGGDTWVLENPGKHFDVEFKPGTPSKVYASGPGIFYYSNDTGNTWYDNSTYIGGQLCAGGRVEIAVAPNSASKVCLLAGPRINSVTFCGFFVSNNSGSSFTRVSNTPNVLCAEDSTGDDQSHYDIGLAVRPDNSQNIIAAGLITYKSTNGGSSFSWLTSFNETGNNYIHPDVHCVAYNPLNNFLYVATDGGLYRSINDGITWTDLSPGINTTQFYHLDDYDADPFTLLAGCQDNGVKYKNTNTPDFIHAYGADGFDMVIDYTNPVRGFASVNNGIYQFSNFITTSPGGPVVTGGFFMPIEMNVSSNNTLYVSSNWVYRYNSFTGSLLQLGTAHGHWALKTCPSNSSRLYAAGGTSAFDVTGDLYMSSNSGTSWDTISDHTGFPANYPRISDIGVKPNNSAYVYVCFSGYTNGLKVLYHTSAGVGGSWLNVSYDLPNVPVWSIEVDANNNIYVGTDFGVYYKAAGVTHWEPFYNGLPNVPVSDLAINESADQLLASTFGRGIWKSTLRTTCPVSVFIMDTVRGRFIRTASSVITMSGPVVGGVGTSAVLRSEGRIDLTPGFRADADPGNKFLAYLGPCDSGLPPVFAPAGQGENTDRQEVYEMKMSRKAGTLEITGDHNAKQLTIRQFEDGPVRIVLTDKDGYFIRDIVNATGQKGESTLGLNNLDLKPGLYFLYLAVNKQVTHLQELEIN